MLGKELMNIGKRLSVPGTGIGLISIVFVTQIISS